MATLESGARADLIVTKRAPPVQVRKQVANLRRKHRHAIAGGRLAEAMRLLEQATAIAALRGIREPRWGVVRIATSQTKD